MPYYVYIDGVQLPVTPSKLELKINNNNKTATLINDGEINILKTPGLSDVSFEILLPAVKYPFAKYPNGIFKEPKYYLEKIEALKVNKKPFQYIVTRTKPNGALMFDTNLKVSLEDYAITDDYKDGFDTTVSIKLKQYRDYSTKTIKITPPVSSSSSASATASSARTSSNSAAKTYTVKKGDCLWNIAKKYLGNGSRYTEIYNLNRDKIRNPSLIYPGQVLTLPS